MKSNKTIRGNRSNFVECFYDFEQQNRKEIHNMINTHTDNTPDWDWMGLTNDYTWHENEDNEEDE